jgi:hypothetical protein
MSNDVCSIFVQDHLVEFDVFFLFYDNFSIDLVELKVGTIVNVAQCSNGVRAHRKYSSCKP